MAFTMAASAIVAPAVQLCHGKAMRRRSSRAGGFFITFLALAGLVWGVVAGNPMAGVLAGTAAGAVLAVLAWLIDRRRAD